MADFDDDLVEDIEEFDVLAEDSPKVISVTNELDIAVAAWHEDGRWTLGILPDPNDIGQIISRLKAQQTNGGSIALISIDARTSSIWRSLPPSLFNTSPRQVI